MQKPKPQRQELWQSLVWFNVKDEVREAATSGIDATMKLKKGKNSPDGLTAEVLQNLSLEQRAQLSADMTRRMRSLDLPEERFETAAALAPKTAGANSPAKYRLIASLSTMRKASDTCSSLHCFSWTSDQDRRLSSKAVTQTWVRSCT